MSRDKLNNDDNACENNTGLSLEQPRAETSADTLPSAVTFFMSAAQRTKLLRALRARSDDRSRALLIALGLFCADESGDSVNNGDSSGGACS